MAPPPPPKEGDELVKAYHNKTVSLSGHREQLMVKVSAPVTGGNSDDKAKLDIVFVLDTSGSMRGKKLEDMKRAMTDFILPKLEKRGRDGVAIIPFNSTVADKQHWYTVGSFGKGERKNAEDRVKKLEAGGRTNIEAGLKAGIEYLKKRRGAVQNASCIFLMSDGLQNEGNVNNLDGDVALHSVVSFAFGENSEETLLYGIAAKSHAGTFQHVREEEDQNKLLHAFADQLGIYSSISMFGVNVTLTANEQAGYKILRADACSYRTNEKGPSDNKKGPSDNKKHFTISFGDLARHENRRILVDLQLPKVEQEQQDMTVMNVKCEYTAPGKANMIPRPKEYSIDIKKGRVRNPPCQAATDANVTRELVRRAQADQLYKVKDFAEQKDMERAREEADKAKNALTQIQDDPDDAVDALFNELKNLEEFLDTYDVYDKLGRAYLLACISSHERQRFSSRGGVVPVDLFRTPRMNKYLDQALKADKNRKPSST